MSNITYVKGDLFELAPAGSYLAHACNCQGIWGSGIAVEFKKRFPKSYETYSRFCSAFTDDILIGDCFTTSEKVVCLLTSKDYGKNKDSKQDILKNTEEALRDFTMFHSEETLHMPKINSGLFCVPWKETEAILKKFDGKLSFVVYEL